MSHTTFSCLFVTDQIKPCFEKSLQLVCISWINDLIHGLMANIKSVLLTYSCDFSAFYQSETKCVLVLMVGSGKFLLECVCVNTWPNRWRTVGSKYKQDCFHITACLFGGCMHLHWVSDTRSSSEIPVVKYFQMTEKKKYRQQFWYIYIIYVLKQIVRNQIGWHFEMKHWNVLKKIFFPLQWHNFT